MTTELDRSGLAAVETAQLRTDLEQAQRAERSHYLGWMVGVPHVGTA